MTRNHLSAYGFSFIFHAVFIALIFTLGNLLPLEQTPLVIDFSILSGNESVPVINPAAKPEQPKVVKQIQPATPKQKKIVKKPPKIEEKKIVAVNKPEPLPIAPVIEEKPMEKEIVAEVEPIKPEIAEQTEMEEIIPLPDAEFAENQTPSDVPPMEAVNNFNDAALNEKASYGYSKQQYLKAHFDYIKNDIQKKVVYPRMARKMGWQGRVLLSFVVCEDGSIKDVKIIESSGYSLLDANAVKTVQSAAPFPVPPIRAEIIIPISYALV
ncbi:MAG: energy transducer TonB [Proteobacteria bacterium]|nr:energy transducer TonB [Pseudomonadota bacterium]MBU1710456.1 energy transducer TonB [Pseudomonadota bacterium]